MDNITFRRGTLDDTNAIYQVFVAAVVDLSKRQGTVSFAGEDDPAEQALRREKRRPLFEHLTRTADEFWVAEREGPIVGYARSILRDGVRELTEFFVQPEAQSAGVGGELLQRAFPSEGATHRVIIATTDVRAQVRYLKTGVVPRFPEMWWSRAPENVTVESDLEFVSVTNTPETVAHIAVIDRAIIGHTRDIDHQWLLENRAGFLYKRKGTVVGYGYLASGCGPMALLDDRDFPAVLAHAERSAFERGEPEVGFDIPQINRAAVDYFLAHKYTLDSFVAFYMSDAPFGKFENYVLTSPPFFI